MPGPNAGARGWTEKVDPAAAMRAVNPAFIPRNHMVEAALSAAVEREDYGPFETLLNVVSRPYRDDPELQQYALPPGEDERVCKHSAARNGSPQGAMQDGGPAASPA